MKRLNADKHSPASSVRSTNRRVRGDAYVETLRFYNVGYAFSGNENKQRNAPAWHFLPRSRNPDNSFIP